MPTSTLIISSGPTAAQLLVSIQNLLIEINQELVAPNFVKDYAPLLIAILVVIIAWRLQARSDQENRLETIQNQIRYEIYQNLTELYGDFIDKASALVKITSFPFILMQASLILGNVTRNPQHITQGQQQAVAEWQKFIAESNEIYFQFSRSLISLMGVFEAWEAVLVTCKPSYLLAYNSINVLQVDVLAYLNYFGGLPQTQWQTWNQVAIQNRADQLKTRILREPYYFYDLMVIVHNEILAKYFGHYRDYRRPTISTEIVLTKEGFKEAADLPSQYSI